MVSIDGVHNPLREAYFHPRFWAIERALTTEGGAIFNLRSLDLNLLTVFEAIYELGSVSAAADRLSLSQSATSHALSRLRSACDDELFIRARQGLAPTTVAQAMYPPIKQSLEGLRATLAEASGFDPTRSRRSFRISIPHPMGPFYALALRRAVAATAPEVALTFDTVSRPLNLEGNLRDGVVDLAVDWLSIELDPFVNRRIFDDTLALIARAGHPAVDRGMTIQDLRKTEFVAPHRRRDIRYLPRALREFYQLGLQEAVHVSELLEIPIVVASTDLMGIFPSSMGPLLRKLLGLLIIPIPLQLPTVPIYLIWHETRSNDTAHRWLRDLAAKELSRYTTA